MKIARAPVARLFHNVCFCCSGNRDLLYLDLALEGAVRGAAERGVGSVGFGASALMAPLLQNLCLSLGDNEEACYCLKAWQGLPSSVR
jgi:alpha-glucan,water dikinase